MEYLRNWSLQMFAEGDDGASAPGGNDGTTEGGTPAQEKPSFDDLLKDDAYGKEFEKRVSRRTGYEVRKAEREARAKLSPMYEALARKYGMDVTDPAKIDLDALSEKVLSDNDLFEEEAAQMGVSVDGRSSASGRRRKTSGNGRPLWQRGSSSSRSIPPLTWRLNWRTRSSADCWHPFRPMGSPVRSAPHMNPSTGTKSWAARCSTRYSGRGNRWPTVSRRAHSGPQRTARLQRPPSLTSTPGNSAGRISRISGAG